MEYSAEFYFIIATRTIGIIFLFFGAMYFLSYLIFGVLFSSDYGQMLIRAIYLSILGIIVLGVSMHKTGPVKSTEIIYNGDSEIVEIKYINLKFDDIEKNIKTKIYKENENLSRYGIKLESDLEYPKIYLKDLEKIQEKVDKRFIGLKTWELKKGK